MSCSWRKIRPSRTFLDQFLITFSLGAWIFLRYLKEMWWKISDLLSDATSGDQFSDEHEFLFIQKLETWSNLIIDHIQNILVLQILNMLQRLNQFYFPVRVSLLQTIAWPCDFTPWLPVETAVNSPILRLRNHVVKSSEPIPYYIVLRLVIPVPLHLVKWLVGRIWTFWVRSGWRRVHRIVLVENETGRLALAVCVVLSFFISVGKLCFSRVEGSGIS